MHLSKKMTVTLGLLVAGTTYGQPAVTSNPTGTGNLGQRYIETSLGLQNVRHISDHAYSVDAGVNTPIVPSSVDAGAFYTYSWLKGRFASHANTFGVYATAYSAMQGVKPFASALVGWEWFKSEVVSSTSYGIWAAAVGVEVPVGEVTFTPRIVYADDFRRSARSSQGWTFQVEGSMALNPTTVVFGTMGKTDVRRTSFDSWNYEIGARFRF
jgi:hypothetical protein